MGALDRAQEDIACGEPWRARNRLSSVLEQEPASQGALDLLGYAYLAMDDLAAAGAAWFLTDRPDEDPDVTPALKALATAYPDPLALARALPIRAPSSAYPPRARRRLAILGSRVRASGQEWEPPGEVHFFEQDGVDVEAFREWPTTVATTRSGIRVVAAVLVVAMLAGASIAAVITLLL
ncbi:hypothetical protein GCM10007304_31180 [Rhodococcoides trifolii]|uniref:Tetratricopeptide repeat protein n=1 Tax=Rhodococcoides trifolii TaxID=908250 RepID=A0A917LDH5_9NOCA|nr:DUF6584 family protein [Rhodococcus trifolii]GGG14892.1 hypothetical protein GCM10007304_31180 [Rhodococcus trifolii]